MKKKTYISPVSTVVTLTHVTLLQPTSPYPPNPIVDPDGTTEDALAPLFILDEITDEMVVPQF
jgi:hypothetical protein